MFINQLNLNQLKVFETVFRTGSMTKAAHELHLTQSGVSQHIQAVESALDTQLFERIKKKVVPTPHATLLYEHCLKGFEEIEQALITLQGDKTELAGSVNIGMPPEFGNNVILPLLAEFAKKHSRVKFNTIYGFTSETKQALLKGELHFAFVDSIELDQQITTEKVYQEVLWLCASKEYLKKKGAIAETRMFFESLDYISFVENDAILLSWFRHHLNWRHPRLNVRATVAGVQGVARLILSHLGVGLLSDHMVEKLKRESKSLHLFQGSGKPLQNTISLAYLQSKNSPHLVRMMMDFLKQKLTG